MRRTRVHVDLPLAEGERVVLPIAARDRLLTVLRLRDGAPIVLFDGQGLDWPGTLRIARGEAMVELGRPVPVATESPLGITLAQAIARGEKMDLILQKATELGVARIVPIVSERTEVRLDGERAARRVEHWRRVVIHACEQCGRARLPVLEPPVALPVFAETAARSQAWRFVLEPDARQGLAVGDARRPVTIAIGPEGGFGDRDLAILRAAGFEGVRLGPRVLRTETAGLAAIATLQAVAGDLR
jgi:16S rRNA (uracil1498-N3)-methyltransferase